MAKFASVPIEAISENGGKLNALEYIHDPSYFAQQRHRLLQKRARIDRELAALDEAERESAERVRRLGIVSRDTWSPR